MNELVPSAHSEGEVLFLGQNIYDRQVDPVEVRRRIGMVFQKPNPFTKSIYENVAWGARLNGFKGGIGNPSMDEWVEYCLRKAALMGRGQRQAQPERSVSLRRAAAAPVHCPCPGGLTGGDPDG